MLSRYVLSLVDLLPSREVSAASCLLGIVNSRSPNLGFGMDEKAAAAVMHYRFFPATHKGKPIAARRDVMVSFTKF